MAFHAAILRHRLVRSWLNQVVAADGTYGCGVTSGGELVCIIVEQHLSRFVEGRDPGDIESMWDQMWRALIPYGRKGVPVHALSGVDLA